MKSLSLHIPGLLCFSWKQTWLILLFGVTGMMQVNAQSDTLSEQTAEPVIQEEAPAPAVQPIEHKKDDYLEKPVEKKEFDRKKWDDARRGMNYDENTPPPPAKEPDPKKEDGDQEPVDSSSDYSVSAPSGTGVPVLKYVLVIAIIILLVFLLVKVFAGQSWNKRIPSEKTIATIEDIEEISMVPESELERLLREALGRRDFKMAIRIYYVFALRELSEKGLIKWKKDKTNREYLMELSALSQYPVFRDLTILFERIWYGDIELVETDYRRVEPLFKSFTDAVKLNKPLEK